LTPLPHLGENEVSAELLAGVFKGTPAPLEPWPGLGCSFVADEDTAAMNSSVPPSGGGGPNAPSSPARNIAEHLARDHPGRFGRDIPRLEREVQSVIDNPTHQHTVQHGPTAGSRFYHRGRRSVMVRPNGQGTMVLDPNGKTFRNWVALEP
jgi:hypothetical protein